MGWDEEQKRYVMEFNDKVKSYIFGFAIGGMIAIILLGIIYVAVIFNKKS